MNGSNLYLRAKRLIRHPYATILPRLRRAGGVTDTQWARVVMNRETEKRIRAMEYSRFDALEISGEAWKNFGFKTYRSAGFPSYDWCAGPLAEGAFDLVIAEQVLEHVLWPYRAVKNAYRMLKPGGTLFVSTPFLLRVHDFPVDCSRWTPLGMQYLLAEGGFPAEAIVTGSWGNRACVRANFHEWVMWLPWKHSLRNEPEFPVVVWAFAQRPQVEGAQA